MKIGLTGRTQFVIITKAKGNSTPFLVRNIMDIKKEVSILRTDVARINERIGIIESRLDTDNDVLIERVDKLEDKTKDLDKKMLEVLVVGEAFKNNVSQMKETQCKLEKTQLELSKHIGKIKITMAYYMGGTTVIIFLANLIVDKLF